MPTAYAYLVISPNPQLGNFIHTGKGVEIKSGGNAKLDYRESMYITSKLDINQPLKIPQFDNQT